MNLPHLSAFHRIRRWHAKARQYMLDDPEGALMFARKTSEAICKILYFDKVSQQIPPPTSLEDLLGKLQHGKHLPQRLAIQFRTIQTHGNFGSHDQGDESDEIDSHFVESCIKALDYVCTWLQEKYLKPTYQLSVAPLVKRQDATGKTVRTLLRPITQMKLRSNPARPQSPVLKVEKPKEVLSIVYPHDKHNVQVPPASTSVEVSADGEKLVHLKPPFTVKDLAVALNLKPFVVIKNLMDIGVFGNQNEIVTPKIAGKICELHGFHFEKERKAK